MDMTAMLLGLAVVVAATCEIQGTLHTSTPHNMMHNTAQQESGSPDQHDASSKDNMYVNSTMSEEKRLINELMRNYDVVGRSGRPVRNVSTPVTVYFSLGLIQMDLNEKAKILTMSMWTRYQWRDEYMTWDPSEYNGVTSIRLDPLLLWIPDITLYNAADAEEDNRHALAVISSDGTVTWFPHTIFRSSCSVNVANFPFDSQQCHMWFGSWTHTSKEINLFNGFDGGIDFSTFKSDYKESCAWMILNVTAKRKIIPSEDSDPNFVVLTFDLYLERKVVFSSYILTLPCIFFAFLTLVVFWLPPDRPDRTGLAMSTFSSFMLLLLILVETAPPTASTVPILGVYYCYNMIIIMLSIFLSSLVVNISRGDTKHLPRWIARILSKMSTCGDALAIACRQQSSMGLKRTGSDSERMTMLNPSTPSPDKLNGHLCDTKLSVTITDSGNRRGNVFSDDMDTTMGINQQLAEIRASIARLEYITTENNRKQAVVAKIRSEWKALATFLDRIFFVLYMLLIFLSLALLFPKPHNFFFNRGST